MKPNLAKQVNRLKDRIMKIYTTWREELSQNQFKDYYVYDTADDLKSQE